MTALVSVVMPTYNHARFIGRALQSVLDQSYPHWEALVVDNHSDDDTDGIVNGFGDPRIRLLKIHNHGVIAASRNLGICEARGDWLAFLDSDDCWYPTKLERLLGAVVAGDTYDVLSNNELMVDVRTGAKKVLRHGPYQKEFYRTLLVEGNRLSPSATVLRREFLVRHGLAFGESESYVTVEDYDLWMNLARNGARFKFIDDVLGEYVVHDTNYSSQLSRHLRNGETLLHDHVFNVQRFEPSPERLWKEVLPRLRLREARVRIASGQPATALKLMLGLLTSSPRATAMYLFSKLKTHLRPAN